ncbi:MAM domain-containing glycosylphosphatidylinositol anchor protein 1-like, partial [Saccostrea cucullata]|uniref:MAM domain-containing glycosylphosphatidylinositol anchor protein 1-like n=1 Tax=Saccostrea cuccullata TaxID=36930 RepID=UPI002ED40F18
GATPSTRTGPSRAASGNYYKFTESSSPRSRGDEASLESNVNFQAGTYCLTLAISMYGNHIGSLEILTKEGTSAEVRHKIYSGNQGRNWFNYSKELTLTPLSKIIIRTKVGGNRRRSFKGDIAVDNIVLENGACI